MQQFIYGYNCVLLHGLHGGFKNQLTPCDNMIYNRSAILEFGINLWSLILRGKNIMPVLREYVEKTVRNVRVND